ncbi:MAG TPA: 3-oxoacyl-ACP reductase FabG [Candidatus Dormibacteraeota bacterium]|nr:3-oxoacyl-ACP reductase FabG [Candidatus Dormibacteraeota bacterium]
MRFDGKVALVTGGGRGIGAATSQLFAKEGAAVAVCDLDEGPAQEVAGPLGDRGLAVACDVSRRDQVEAAVQRTVDAFGRLDILVACAGITRDNLIHKMSDDDWDGVIDTHLKGTFLCAQAAQRAMVPQRYGKMVFLSSTSANGNRGQTNYSTAKAGLQGMARTLAIELGPFGINVNAVAPGFIETRMTEATARRMGVDWEDFKKAAAERTPVRRNGKPEDVANVIAFLCSDEAGFVSGQTLYVRGGP